MAQLLHRVMHMRLAATNAETSPKRALACLRRIQYHRIQLDANPVSGVSTIKDEQSEILRALNVKKPALPQQLALV